MENPKLTARPNPRGPPALSAHAHVNSPHETAHTETAHARTQPRRGKPTLALAQLWPNQLDYGLEGTKSYPQKPKHD
jgi:hypothetical protein